MPLVSGSNPVGSNMQEPIHCTRCESREEWTSLYYLSAAFTYAQSWAYARTLAAHQHAETDFYIFSRAGTPVGCAVARVKQLPGLPLAVHYISRGPVPFVRTSGSELSELCESAAEACLARRRGIVRIAPPLLAEPPDPWPPSHQGWESGDKDYRTIVLDLALPLESIRGSFHQKWRNSLNSASRKGAEIERADGPDAVERFAPLYQATAARKGFTTVLGPHFYSCLQRDAGPEDRLTCYFAVYEGNDVGGLVAWMGGGTATYLLGASTPDALRLNAGYLLQWRAIQDAKERGCNAYDLGGIDPDNNPDVYRFKSRMGGMERTSACTIERASGALARAGLRAAEYAYSRWRRR